MTTVNITSLLQAYNVKDFGAVGNENGDDSGAINAAMTAATQGSNGIIFIPPGTYRIQNPLIVPSNVVLFGFGSSSVLKLGPGANCDIIQSVGTSNVRIKDLKLEGNRGVNTSGNGIGVYFYDVTDIWMDNVEVVSCRADGFQLYQCERVELKGCLAKDNGRHGFSLNVCTFCLMVACRSYDNGRVPPSDNVMNGIDLDVLTTDCNFIGCHSYATSLTTGAQGYGIRERAAGGCARNLILGGAFRGNGTDFGLLEPDSMAILCQPNGQRLITGNLGLKSFEDTDPSNYPTDSAVLDVYSLRQGFAPPRMTTAQKNAIASPLTGLIVYDTTTNKLQVYTGSAWEAVTSA